MIGLALIDSFTFYNLEFFERVNRNDEKKKSIENLFNSYNPTLIRSHPGQRSSLSRHLRDVPVTDFFGSDIDVELTTDLHILQKKKLHFHFFSPKNGFSFSLSQLSQSVLEDYKVQNMKPTSVSVISIFLFLGFTFLFSRFV